MKKVLSLVLVIAMVLSSFSFAFAAKFEDVEGDYEEAVNVLTALGVITGYEDGTYRPERIVTRAEMAKLIVEILGYGDLVAGSASNFADTQGHWADAWISLAAGRGLVIGTGDGNFAPDRQVSYDEAITMVIRALGYTDASNELKNMTWPTNFKVKASELGLLDGVKSLAGGADRGGVAKLLFNALEAILVTVDTDGNVVYVKDANKEDKPLLSRLAEKADIDVVEGYADPEHKDYKGDVVDLYQYMYQNITVYEKDDVVVFVKGVNSLVFTGTVTEINEDEITIEDADEDEFTFKTSDVDDFMYNNEGVSSYDFDALEPDKEPQVTVVLKGEDGDKIKDDIEVLAVVATQASGYVRVEDVYEKDELTLDAIYLPKDGKVVDADNLVIKGEVDALEDIDEDDVLAVFVPLDKDGNDEYFETKAANKMTIIVARETVEGRLTRISGDDHTIDGKVYGLNVDGPTLVAGDEGLFFLDHEGKIFDFDAEGSGKPGDYALVLDITDGWQTAVDGVVLADPKVKLLTAAGEEITYELDLDLDVVNDEDYVQTIKVVDLAEGDVVEYDLDKSNVIDELEVVDMGSKLIDLKTDVNSFNLASSAVIFNVPSGNIADTKDADVITADDLDDEIDAYRFRNTKGQIEVLVVTKGGAEVDEIFGMITKDNGKAYDEDEEKQVTLFTAYVDGAKVEYLAHKDEKGLVKESTDIVELTLTGGKLKATKVETPDKTGVAENSRITNSITDADDDTKVYFLADDVAIYVLKDNGTKFDKVGVKSDIRGKNFKLYDTVDAGDEDYDIVVVWTGPATPIVPEATGVVTYIDTTVTPNKAVTAKTISLGSTDTLDVVFNNTSDKNIPLLANGAKLTMVNNTTGVATGPTNIGPASASVVLAGKSLKVGNIALTGLAVGTHTALVEITSGTDVFNSEIVITVKNTVASASKVKVLGVEDTTSPFAVAVPFGTNLSNLTASNVVVTPTDPNATVGAIDIVLGTESPTILTATITVEIIAEDGIAKADTVIAITIAAASSVNTLSSTTYVVDNTGHTITMPATADVAVFKSKLTPAANATFEVYLTDGTTIKTGDMITGDKVIVKAQDGTPQTYVVTVQP